MGVGEAKRREPHCHLALALALPVDAPVEGFERDARLGENARKIERGLARGEGHAAFRLGRLDRSRQSGEPRHLAARVHAEIGKAAARGNVPRRGKIAAPLELRIEQPAARRQIGQELAHVPGQGQRGGELCKRLQIDHVGRRRARGVGAGRSRLEHELEIRRGDGRSIFSAEGYPATAEFIAVAARASLQAAAHGLELKRRKIMRQPRGDPRERHVRRALLHAAVFERSPDAQRALPCAHIERVVDPRPPGREVGVAELGVEPAVPGRGIGRAAAFQLGTQFETRAERLRRTSREPDRMVVARISQAQVQRGKRQRRRGALLVAPLDLGVADDDVFLPEQPVGEAALAVGRQLHAGDVQGAVGVAAHFEPRPVDGERIQPKLAVQQRAPRDDVMDRRQRQNLAALVVVEVHVREADLRPQAEPSCLDAGDLDRQADGALDRRDDVAAIALDVRQQPKAQREHQRREDEKRDPGERFNGSPQRLHGGIDFQSSILTVDVGTD